MTDLSEKELEYLRTAEVRDEQCERAYHELRRHRAAAVRVAAVLAQMELCRPNSTERIFAAELRAAVTGRKFLYRCPEHGDMRPTAFRHERGVVCGHTNVVKGEICSRTAVLVGEVDG